MTIFRWCALLVLCLFVRGVAAAAEPLRVCILSGCPTYKSEESLPPFQQWLEKNYDVKCTRIARTGHEFPDLQKLDECDVLLVFFKRMELKGEQLDRFKKYATSGKPIVAVRTASHAVQSWLDFDREVLGGNYHGHYEPNTECKLAATSGGRKHPILDGVELTTVKDALYKNDGHADDIQVLVEGAISNTPSEPVAWTRRSKRRPSFLHVARREDTFQLPGFRRMLANALFWTAQREPK